jgi:hypothetical protein
MTLDLTIADQYDSRAVPREAALKLWKDTREEIADKHGMKAMWAWEKDNEPPEQLEIPPPNEVLGPPLTDEEWRILSNGD